MTAGAREPAVALTIAGSDSGGGAGIQADLKTFHQFGVYGTSAIVAVTAQNTCGVTAVHPVPLDTVAAQLDAVATDLPPRAVKTGMLATAELIGTVVEAIHRHDLTPLVVDPVMVATSGDRLLEADAASALRDTLVPLATLVTPNLAETEALTGIRPSDRATMERAGRALVTRGATAALIKGGHGEHDTITDVLVTGNDVRIFTHPRIITRSTHGTGCTLSAAITAGLARGDDLATAVEAAVTFVHRAIASASPLGAGHGPLNHFVAAPAPRPSTLEVS